MKIGDAIKPRKDPIGGRGSSWWEGELESRGWNRLPEDYKFGIIEKFDSELGMILSVLWPIFELYQSLAISETDVEVLKPNFRPNIYHDC